MEPVTKRKAIEAVLADAGKHVPEMFSTVTFGVGAILAIFLIVCPSSAWYTIPTTMSGSLNLSVILMMGGLIMEGIRKILARLDALAQAHPQQ